MNLLQLIDQSSSLHTAATDALNDFTATSLNMAMDDDAMATDDTSSSQPFCQSSMGGGMIMYMDGFRWTLKGGDQPCLNLYFKSWTLDTAGKFAAAMIGVFLMAVAVEGLSKWRHSIVRAAKRKSPAASANTIRLNRTLLRWGITALHGTQALMGYVLMLATMTFSAELLLCVVVGLAMGYALFFQTEDDYLNETIHVSTNPCCNFMGEEANELGKVTTTPSTRQVSSCCQYSCGDDRTDANSDFQNCV